MNSFGHGGNVEEIARRLNINSKKLIDFSANINPLGLNENLKNIMIKSIDKAIRYPDITYYEAKRAISDYENFDIDDTIIGNGAAEVIFNVVRALSPKKALIPSPTFSEYESACKSIDCEVSYYNLKEKNNFELDDEFLDFINNDIDVIFICNPNNPTGVLTKNNFLEKIVEKAKKTNTFIIFDESFLDFVKEKDKYSVIDLVNKYNNIVLIKSATKFFAIPGIRIGYGYFKNNELKEHINKISISWSVNTLASDVIKNAFLETEYIKNTVNFVNSEKDYLYKELNKFSNIQALKPSVNFIMFKLLNSNIDLYKELLMRGFIVRRCSNYEGLNNTYYRVAVRTRKENELLINALREIL